MFNVKWVTHQSEKPIEIEDVPHSDLDEVVASRKKKLSLMRVRPWQTRPDGFVVFDSFGKEVRRWFGRPRFTASEAHVPHGPALLTTRGALIGEASRGRRILKNRVH